jgi:hypothetical protein
MRWLDSRLGFLAVLIGAVAGVVLAVLGLLIPA